MERRTFVRRGIPAVTLGVAIAGCSGDGDDSGNGGDGGGGDDGDGGGGDGGAQDGPATVGESGLQREITNRADPIAVTAIEEVEVTDKRVELDVTMLNNADEDVQLDHYALTLVFYDTDEPGGETTADTMDMSQQNNLYDDPEPVAPGETGTLRIARSVTDDAGTIRSYRVIVACGGVYNPPGCDLA